MVPLCWNDKLAKQTARRRQCANVPEMQRSGGTCASRPVTMIHTIAPWATCSIIQTGMESPCNCRKANDSCCVELMRWDDWQPTGRWVFCCPISERLWIIPDGHRVWCGGLHAERGQTDDIAHQHSLNPGRSVRHGWGSDSATLSLLSSAAP